MQLSKQNPCNKFHFLIFNKDVSKISDVIISCGLFLLLCIIFIGSSLIIKNYASGHVLETVRIHFEKINSYIYDLPSINKNYPLMSCLLILVYLVNLFMNSFGLTIVVVLMITLGYYPFSNYIRKNLKGVIDSTCVLDLRNFPKINYSWILLLITPFSLIITYLSIISIPSILINIIFLLIKNLIVKVIRKINFPTLSKIKTINLKVLKTYFLNILPILNVLFKILYIVLGFIIFVKVTDSIKLHESTLYIQVSVNNIYSYIIEFLNELNKIQPYGLGIQYPKIKESVSFVLLLFGIITMYGLIYIGIFQETKFFKIITSLLSGIYVILIIANSSVYYYFIINIAILLIAMSLIIISSGLIIGIGFVFMKIWKKINKEVKVTDNIARDILKILNKK